MTGEPATGQPATGEPVRRGPVIISELLDDNLFRLVEPVVMSIGQTRIIVPDGYVTDFASLPSVLHWWIRPTDSRGARAAIVHDWIYHTHIYPRCVADAFYQVILRQDGMPRRKAKLLCSSVHAFGKGAYMRGPDKLRKRTPHLAAYIKGTPIIE